ncbi:FAS1-like dehydratase domain-containing protein [Sphingomonas profundi]|uniref:FAS1-like dehydratase domain-containing protein n=1 Tax=Alterirhizorhabdus profundi TaxID=2681549 RepID=UPI0012E95267|nr:MaoC family dehydratase N-terminal domain-containing protein [Sphingomonas profundi]
MSADEPIRDRTAPTQGSYEEGKALLGRRSSTNFGSHPASAVRSHQFLALIEDANASYWDEATAIRLWGRPVAPPAMLQALTMPLPWLPDRQVELDYMLMKLPLPGSTLINISTEVEYHRPIYLGETLNFWDVATDISEEKETRLGIGRFVTTVSTYQNDTGEVVATLTNIQFRYEPRKPA